ncbi:MAG: glycosyltransferase family 4 protein, partial [Planctomycetes bacterium]|nr:glycosyltransferase family 4 protein [Planctomycetota bacterium]
SKFTSREFLEYGIPEEKIIEIIPAVDSDMFVPLPKPADLMEKHKLHGKMTVLTVSRLVERKGHDTILKALPQVLEAIPNLHYIIVGDGPDRENLKTLSKRLNLYTHVTFAGQVPDEALVKYYNLCDVFVMPNREVFNSTDSIEGFGITFIEANACGKPVIGGLSGGAVEAINDGVSGFLVDPLDKDKVAEKMIYLLQNVDAAGKIGKAGRKRAEEEFSWETRARELSVQLKTKLSMTN